MSRAPASRGNGWGNGALAALCRPSSPTSASFAVDAARGSAKTSRPAPANPASSWTFGERQALLAYVESPTHPIAVTYMSACMEAKTGRRTSELAEPDRYWDLVHPQDVAMVRAEHDEAATGRRLLSLEYRLLAQDGTVAYVRDEARSVPTGDPERFALEGYCLDITAHRRIEEDLRAGEERFRTLVANIPGVVYRCGCDWLWTMQFMSDSIQELSGYPATDFLANRVRTYGSIIHPEDRSYVFEAIDEALADGSAYEMHYRILHADGGARWIAEQGTAVLGPDGERLWLDGVIFDITERRLAEGARDRAEKELKRQAQVNRHQALHDSLTGLPNRTLFHDRLRLALAEAAHTGGQLAVLMMDLDRFKEINDTLGHASGDCFLQEVGRRVLAVLRPGDSIARLGGDEFGLLVPGASVASAVALVGRIRDAVGRPCALDDLTVSVDASLGVAFFPDHGTDADQLLRRADVALYAAKEADSGSSIYRVDDDRHEPMRLSLVSELRRAIDEGELELHYQPKVELRNGQVVGVEALVRWRHPERGLVPPDDFIPLAQSTGLIKPLTLSVIDEALRQCQAWCAEGHALPIAVNVSPRSLIDLDFPDDVIGLLAKWDVAPFMLELELTESAMVADPIGAAAVLQRLSDIGMRLAVDDFGTGYSSLAYLTRLPIDEIKIDRSFVKSMSHSPNDAVIVRSTIDLGRNLGLEVVAEGVEDLETWMALAELGCDVAQGYYMSRPMPAVELTGWLGELPAPSQPPRWGSQPAGGPR